MTNNIQITDRGGIYRARFHGGNIVGFGSCPEDAVDHLRWLSPIRHLVRPKESYEQLVVRAIRPKETYTPRTDFGIKLKEAVS